MTETGVTRATGTETFAGADAGAGSELLIVSTVVFVLGPPFLPQPPVKKTPATNKTGSQSFKGRELLRTAQKTVRMCMAFIIGSVSLSAKRDNLYMGQSAHAGKMKAVRGEADNGVNAPILGHHVNERLSVFADALIFIAQSGRGKPERDQPEISAISNNSSATARIESLTGMRISI